MSTIAPPHIFRVGRLLIDIPLNTTDFQWCTSWLANNFLPEEIIGSLDTNTIFLLALFFTVGKYSLQSNGIRVIDVLIIHQLCVGFLFSIMSLWGYRTSKLPSSRTTWSRGRTVALQANRGVRILQN